MNTSMNFEWHTAQLQQNAETILQMVRLVPDDQARWKPDPNSWSILEVINHLYDEEREDFRPRLDVMLHHPDEVLPRIDPVRWVTERAYNQRDPSVSSGRFMSERNKSLMWLRSLRAPNWDSVYRMTWGPMRAGDMLASWVAHDLLHMRQLVRLQFLYARHEMEPYQVAYAGSW